MEVSKLCSSGIKELRRRSNRYDRMLSSNVLMTTSKLPRWRLLWRKFMKGKKKIFVCSSRSTTVVVHNVSYDAHKYAQNFDQGLISADPDDFSRSFSARFAVPSRVFEKTGFLGCSN